MYHFTIKDIENLCGIKAHTLRIWEQRYPVLTPKRKGSHHRMYTNEDLKKLLRISLLYHQGWKISAIAQLSPARLFAAVQETGTAQKKDAYFILQLIEKALDFDKEAFIVQLDDAIHTLGFEACIVNVCYPILQRIGLLWVIEKLVPAQEHFCSYIIQHKIIAETDKLPPPPKEAPEILLFSPHGEHHELALHFINYLLRKWGWTTLFAGPDIKPEVLKPFAAAESLTHVFLHATVNFTGFGMDDYFEEICKLFRNKKVVASGAAVFGMQRTFVNLLLLKSDEAIYRFVRREWRYFGVA